MRSEDLLILGYDGFSERTAHFFRGLNESRALQELFLRDPAGTLSAEVLPPGKMPAAARLNQANRILFSLLSNPNFTSWSEQYQKGLEAEMADIVALKDPSEEFK